MQTRLAAGSAAAVFLFCLALAGCGRPPTFEVPADGISRFPTGDALREGDVLLARSYGLVGAMFANYSEAGGKYSHGAMVYRSAAGKLMILNYRPTGMETCSPEEFISRYNRLALVRYAGSLAEAAAPAYVQNGGGLTGGAALSAAARHWLAADSRKRIPPDYHLDHDEHSAMFCLELTSAVYRDCSLPDPFHRARKAAADPLLSKANALFKADVYEIRSPSSALANPAFTLVTDWIRPDYDLREEALNESLMRVVVEDIESGLVPRRPGLGARVKLRQIFFLYHLITKAMFWREKQDLPDFIDSEVIGNAYMLYSYAARSKAAAKKRMYAETKGVTVSSSPEERDAAAAAVRRIVEEETGRQRAIFLCRPGEAFPN